jgi:hypothetical protein
MTEEAASSRVVIPARTLAAASSFSVRSFPAAAAARVMSWLIPSQDHFLDHLVVHKTSKTPVAAL